MNNRTEYRWAAALVSAFVLTASANAEHSMTTQFSLPLQVEGIVNTLDCNNSAGPIIVLEGNVILNGVTMRFILQNNLKGTHQTVIDTHVDTALILPGSEMVIPKQPSRGGVGGNPHIWIQLLKDDNTPVGTKTYLGRCVQGWKFSSGPQTLDCISQLTVGIADCQNSPGPFISVSGKVSFEQGLKARFTLQNNLRGTHIAIRELDVQLLGQGDEFVVPKQPVNAGVGGNPLIWCQMLLEDVLPSPIALDEPAFLGRCNQLD